MTRIKLLVLGTGTALMILGSSIVFAAPPADDPATDRDAAVADAVMNVRGGGGGRALPK